MTTSSWSAASRWRRGAVTVLPAAMPLAMKAVFTATTRRYGPVRGYQAGFAVYWASCWAVAGITVGRRGLRRLWAVPEQSLPIPRALGAAVLAAPPVGGLTTQWLPHAGASGLLAVAVAAGVGTTNALAEGVFWRGVPVATFPDDPVRGWLWPAAGFTAWHWFPSLRDPRA